MTPAPGSALAALEADVADVDRIHVAGDRLDGDHAASDQLADGSADSEDVVHLGSGDPLVPPELLTPPFREEARGLLRDLAALLLDRHLRRLARMRNPVDLRIGRMLAQLDQVSGCVALGFARLADYAAERLGLPVRRARDLVTLARGLAPLPRLAAAFEAGRISRSQASLLLRVATSGSEAAWLERAGALNVRQLDREVRAALAAAGGAATSAGDASGAGTAPSLDAATRTAPIATVDSDDAPMGEWVDLPVPGRMRPIWDRAVELARRSSGAPDPIWSCVEFIAADFLAGVPGLASILAREVGAGIAAGGEPSDAEDAANALGAQPAAAHPGTDQDDTDLFEEVIRALEDDSGARRWTSSVAGLRVVLPQPADPRPDDTPRALDLRLRDLVRLRQDIAWHQGRLLRLFVGRRLHREIGFLSFSRYCRERAGLGVRRAWDLVALERRLWLLPRIAEAYRSGRLSWVRAAAISRVATETTEDAWLRLALSVTVRRLEEEVALVQMDDGPPSYGQAPPPGLDAEGRVQLSAPGSRAGSAARTAPAAGSPPVDQGGVQTSASADDWTRLRFWAPHDVAALWHQAMRVARTLLEEGGNVGREAIGEIPGAAEPSSAAPPADWQCAEKILAAFLGSWSVRADPTWLRHHRIFERDGWRCRVPGCSSRRNLQVHHVVFRSRGGGDEDANLAVLCAAHHLQGIHRGRLRCYALPEGLLAWEFAPDSREGPLARFVEDVEWIAARASVAQAPSPAA